MLCLKTFKKTYKLDTTLMKKKVSMKKSSWNLVLTKRERWVFCGISSNKIRDLKEYQRKAVNQKRNVLTT